MPQLDLATFTNQNQEFILLFVVLYVIILSGVLPITLRGILVRKYHFLFLQRLIAEQQIVLFGHIVLFRGLHSFFLSGFLCKKHFLRLYLNLSLFFSKVSDISKFFMYPTFSRINILVKKLVK